MRGTILGRSAYFKEGPKSMYEWRGRGGKGGGWRRRRRRRRKKGRRRAEVEKEAQREGLINSLGNRAKKKREPPKVSFLPTLK